MKFLSGISTVTCKNNQKAFRFTRLRVKKEMNGVRSHNKKENVQNLPFVILNRSEVSVNSRNSSLFRTTKNIALLFGHSLITLFN